MTGGRYFSEVGGLPPQTQTLASKAVFTTAYAVIPKSVMSDIVTAFCRIGIGPASLIPLTCVMIFHLNIVTFESDTIIPFMKTRIMELLNLLHSRL